MAESKLVGLVKEVSGKTALKRQRKEGFIPANLYGPELKENKEFFLNEKELSRAIKSGKKIHTLTIDGEEHMVILREIQRHPVSWNLIHADIVALTAGKKTRLKVPVRYEGTPVGVKDHGGVLIINSRYVYIEALPKFIPDEIVINVEPLSIKQTVHASDIDRENITVVSPGGQLLCSCAITRAAVAAGEAEGEEGEEGEEGAEGEEGTEGEASAEAPAEDGGEKSE